jgi:hypothetical protein
METEAISRLPPVGAIAQLGERLNGIQEVSGSIPLGSTNYINGLRAIRALTANRALFLRTHPGLIVW